LAHSGLDGTLTAVKDGEEAIDYLTGKGRYSDRMRFPLPNVIFTDLKMPGMSGFDLLEWLRANPKNAVIPTVVFSSSCLENDVEKAYRLGASSFLVKPHNLRELVRLVRTTSEYWSMCETPPVLTHCE
jgi:CheY-like chemotaxis protein